MLATGIDVYFTDLRSPRGTILCRSFECRKFLSHCYRCLLLMSMYELYFWLSMFSSNFMYAVNKGIKSY